MRVGHRKIDCRFLKNVGALFIPVVLYFIPIEWLIGNHSFCLIKNIFGVECWGCGITRAVVSAVQCNFVSAYHYNKLIVVVFPLLVYIWAKIFVTTLKSIVVSSSPRWEAGRQRNKAVKVIHRFPIIFQLVNVSDEEPKR